jgi:hypothetical protein
VCKSAHLVINTSDFRLTSMVEVWRDGKILLITMCTARSSKEKYVYSILIYQQRVNIIQWREYNPWDLTGRLDANMNMYEAPGGCSVFRAFQSWLGLSRHGPQEGKLFII